MKRTLVFLCAWLVSFFSYSQDLLSQQKAERLFSTGIDLIDHNQYGAAREVFSEYLSTSAVSDARRAEAAYYKAFCALNLYHTDSEKQIEDFIKDNPTHPKAITANYDLGNFYYAEKNFKKASLFYTKVDFSGLSQEQQRIGRFRWGYSLFNQKFLKESLEQFNYNKTIGGEYGPASSYYAGFIEYSQGDYTNALIDLKRAEQNEAYSKIVPYLIANVYYRQKNYDELISYAAKVSAAEGVSNKEEIALLSAEAYYKKNDFKNALVGYKQYLEGREEKADKGVMLRAGYVAYTLGEDAAAIKYLKGSFADSDSVGFYSAYYLGSLYLKQNQKPMAQTAFDIARKYKPDQKLVEESTYQFAKVSYDLGRPDQAIAEFEKMLVTFPNSTHADEIKELLSQAYVNATNYNKAIEYIEAMPKRSPAVDRAFQKATMLKGIELFNKEDYPAAVQYFEKSLKYPIDPDYVAETSFWCGEAYSIGKKYEQAAEQYQRIIGINGYGNQDILLKARYGLGYAYYNLQQYDRALFNFKEFVNKAPRTQSNLSDGMLRLADCYYVSKSYPEALINYRKVVQYRSVDEDYAHLQSGAILGIMRKYEEAGAELDLIIKNYPQSRILDEALFQRAQLDFEQGNYASAVTGYSTLIQTKATSRFVPYAYTRRAASYFNLKEYNKTAQDYITVLENYGSHPASNDVLIPLQEALNLSGRSSDFDKYLAEFKTAHPDAKGIESVEFESSKNLYFNQDYQKAITALTRYTNSYPESPRLSEAKYYQAESYYRLKDWNKALSIYAELAQDKTFLFASKVIGRLAELEFKQGHYEKAVPYFQQLARLASNKKEQYTAWSGLLDSYYLLAQYDSADVYARVILEKGNINAGAQNKASLFLGKSAMARGDYVVAQDEFLNTLNSAQDEYGAEAKYLLGEIQYLTKENKQCYETLVSLNSDFAAYPEWVGKSFLLLADNYLAMGDSFQAKGTLKSLETFPLENIKALAREKLKKIEGEELKKANQVKADTLDN
ncbi:MAG TPA: tetratricopeptide repeat protein [Cyclobacteriaceae bacterium]|nr:tetratricopeptide repeat protein [Cyclobacteriaceae bacterium]